MNLRLALDLPFGVHLELLTWTGEQPDAAPETSPGAEAPETTAVRDLGPAPEPTKPPPLEGGSMLGDERGAGYGFAAERPRWSPFFEGEQPDP